MKRRSFLAAGSIASMGLAINKANVFGQKMELIAEKIKARKLNPGDSVAIISPATAVSDTDDIAKAIEILEYLNLKPILAKSLVKGSGYKSRTVQERLDDLHQAFADKTIKAVMPIRGGYGSAQLLEKIDYALIKQNPKVFVGYSDITAMHIAIYQRTGLITFHGPVLLSQFNTYTMDIYKKALFSSESIGEIKNPESNSIRDAYPIRVIRAGKAEGEIVGGNLSLICSLMGTPFELNFKNKILFIEDVGEEPYRIDRMLTQLRLSGKLKSAKGIIVGKCADCIQKAVPIWDYGLAEVLDLNLSDLGIPVAYGFMLGHTSEQMTIPMGVYTEFDADNEKIVIKEPALLE